MAENPRRRRDPEARRREIVTAAASLIVESGVDALTHRKVAAKAGVPLGATTQYFATLDDLRDAALRELAAGVDAQIEATRAAIARHGATAEVLARVVHAGLADARGLREDRAVVTAAVHDPRVRALARRWSDEFAAFLAPVHGTERATAAAVFIDGLLWHALMHDGPPEERLIRNALTGILGMPATSASAARDDPGT